MSNRPLKKNLVEVPWQLARLLRTEHHVPVYFDDALPSIYDKSERVYDRVHGLLNNEVHIITQYVFFTQKKHLKHLGSLLIALYEK